MEKVIVLLASYNGEKYLRDQLDSLINQTYKNIDVYIRDDNSTDKTMDIINEYCGKSINGINFIKVDSCGRNLGYPDCFWEILKNVPRAKYYCFCDQDDYWLPEKIESSVKCLEKVDSTIPAMTYCAFDYYNQNMEYLRSGENILNNYSFERGIYYTYATGFTQMINRALVDSLDFDYIIGKNLAHDIWCQWIATSIGKIVPNKTVLAKFRRHESAVTSGNKSKLASVKRWWTTEICGDEMKKWHQSLCYFKKAYINDFNDETASVLSLFANENKSFSNKIKKLFYPKKLKITLGGEIALRILFLLGKC